MAHVVQRNKSYAVVYGYRTEEGERKQKWETFYSEREAYQRKYELENPSSFMGEKSRIYTLNDLLDEYIELHGHVKWSMSTYSESTGLMRNYVRPHIGNMPIKLIDRHYMSRYFQKLRVLPRVANKYKRGIGSIGTVTIQEIYKLLHSVFRQAVYWGNLDENPVSHIELPSYIPNKKLMLSPEQLQLVINETIRRKDYPMALLIQLAFFCSMRKGEILGLGWSDVDLERGCIRINKELSRVSLDALQELNHKGVNKVYPQHVSTSKSILVLKEPKTHSAVRTVYMPKSFTAFMKARKDEQQRHISLWEEVYRYPELVVAQENGHPYCPQRATDQFKALLADLNLPSVHFHSIRYSSTSFKLILSGGDIKAVQGDNGHAQPDMVLSVYAQIQEERRIRLAEEMEQNFCLQITPLSSENAQK